MKLVIFDLDGTLNVNDPYLRRDVLAKDAIEVLENYKKRNIKIALCSFNESAIEILQEYKIEHYFDKQLRCVGYPEEKTKVVMLIQLLKMSDVDASETIFYDDDLENIRDARKLGINAIMVNWLTGIETRQIV